MSFTIVVLGDDGNLVGIPVVPVTVTQNQDEDEDD